MEFVIATNNKKKLEEMKRLLEAAGHSAVGQAEAGVNLNPIEDGESFADNALIKARAVAKACKKATLGDDSGLEVDALGGAPGIKSARFAGVPTDDAENNRKLLQLLERYPFARRGGRFVCALALVMPDGRELVVEGTCDGRIGFAKSGDNGFGYDPLFYVDSRSFADMSDEEKDQISHRANAVKKLAEALPGFLKEGGA